MRRHALAPGPTPHPRAPSPLPRQDRCTKNFFIYRDPGSGQWAMFPWDLESGGWRAGAGGRVCRPAALVWAACGIPGAAASQPGVAPARCAPVP